MPGLRSFTPAKVLDVVRQQRAYAKDKREQAARARRQPVPDGPALFVYGHSYMAGFDGSEVWPQLVADALGRTLVNRAVGGDSSKDTLARAQLVDGRPDGRDLVLVEVGLNDVIRWGRDPGLADGFRTRLTAIVTALGAARATVRVLADVPLADWASLPRGHDQGSDAASAALREVALSFPAAIDLWSGWEARSMLVADGVHPNRAGVEAIAATVLGALRA
jgi:lysophospholipase L1-like esterase